MKLTTALVLALGASTTLVAAKKRCGENETKVWNKTHGWDCILTTKLAEKKRQKEEKKELNAQEDQQQQEERQADKKKKQQDAKDKEQDK